MKFLSIELFFLKKNLECHLDLVVFLSCLCHNVIAQE